MSFFASAGRIRVTDANGVEKFDTDDDLFHIVGSSINGSRTFPEIGASNGNIIIDTKTFNVGTCHVACTHVIGAVQFSGAAGGAVGFDRWTTYMGGTLVWILNGEPKTANGNYAIIPSDYVAYRFYCASGIVRLEQRVIFQGSLGPDSYAAIRAHTIAWRLKAGLFT